MVQDATAGRWTGPRGERAMGMDGETTRWICPECRGSVVATGPLDADQEADIVAAVLGACVACRDALCPHCGLPMTAHAEMVDWGAEGGGSEGDAGGDLGGQDD